MCPRDMVENRATMMVRPNSVATTASLWSCVYAPMPMAAMGIAIAAPMPMFRMSVGLISCRVVCTSLASMLVAMMSSVDGSVNSSGLHFGDSTSRSSLPVREVELRRLLIYFGVWLVASIKTAQLIGRQAFA